MRIYLFRGCEKGFRTMSTNRRPVKRSSGSAFRRAMAESKLELFLLVVLVAVIIGLIVYSLKGKKGSEKEPANTVTKTPTVTLTDNVTPSVDPVTGTPEPTDSPTPTPSPYPAGLCESVVIDGDVVPVPKEDWPIDYLMLVNWDYRLKYTGNPENLIRIDEVLTDNWYKIENPVTVAEGSRNFVIECEEDKYSRGNRVAVGKLNEMCHAYHDATGYGVKISQTGAYRNYATQDRFWQNRDKSINPPRTIPGNASDHRTGLGFDIWVLDNEQYDYAWFRANCFKYGFILRYPSDKTAITGITYEQWHFRYVGVEAATEMHELNMCLEEYVAYKNQQ